MITDVGMDMVAGTQVAQCFRYCGLTESATPVTRDSGVITFTRVGNVVTASAPFFTAQDAGRRLKWDTGERAKIQTFNSDTEVITTDSGAIAAAQGTIWYTNETGLSSEYVRTANVSATAGDNQSTFFGGTWTHQRIFIFPAPGVAKVINGLCVSPNSAAATNAFAIFSVPGDIITGVQQYKVRVRLLWSGTPAASTVFALSSGTFDMAGTHGIEAFHMCTVGAGGDTSDFTQGIHTSLVLEPGMPSPQLALSTAGTAIQGINSSSFDPGNIVTKSMSPAGYGSGTFARTFSATFTVNEGNSAAIRSIFIRRSADAHSMYRVLTTTAQTKADTHTLALTLTIAWDREMNN